MNFQKLIKISCLYKFFALGDHLAETFSPRWSRSFLKEDVEYYMNIMWKIKFGEDAPTDEYLDLEDFSNFPDRAKDLKIDNFVDFGGYSDEEKERILKKVDLRNSYKDDVFNDPDIQNIEEAYKILDITKEEISKVNKNDSYEVIYYIILDFSDKKVVTIKNCAESIKKYISTGKQYLNEEERLQLKEFFETLKTLYKLLYNDRNMLITDLESISLRRDLKDFLIGCVNREISKFGGGCVAEVSSLRNIELLYGISLKKDVEEILYTSWDSPEIVGKIVTLIEKKVEETGDDKKISMLVPLNVSQDALEIKRIVTYLIDYEERMSKLTYRLDKLKKGIYAV